MICNFCETRALSSGSSESRIDRRRPFAIAGASAHYAPDWFFRLEHILFDINVDPKAALLQGSVTHTVRAVVSGQKLIRLDQIGLQIEEASVQGEKVDFTVEGHSLIIPLRKPSTAGESLEFSVKYRVEKPRRGIYFSGPDFDFPNKPYQVWTQGQDEDSRYWFPTLDYPNQKATSEMKVGVPHGFTAISNGALISKEKVGDQTRFHYKLGTPHVTYLVSLVVGEFEEWSDQGPRGLDVRYFVARGRKEDGQRAFHNTPKMIQAFESKTGVAYPYEKYSQAAVQDFIFGGMENTSSTTQTDLTLHDERAHLDFVSDPLVAHELAHQWFGDLLTCRDWSHGWLNEGFATFMERVWIESNPGKNGGIEEAKYYSYHDLKVYLGDDRNRYRRPIVCNTYIEPIDLFDTHLYQKGGLVLNLIRSVLGEDLFWKSIHLYLTRHRGQNVETIDLIRAIEDASGKNLRRFFDEWVFNAGYPEFEVSYTWHEDKKLTEWIIEQKQTGGAPSVTHDGITTLLFHLPVVLEISLAHGEKISHQIQIGEHRERVFLPASSKPVMVRFDPGFTIPKTLKFPRPKEMLLYQLKNDADCMGRIEAIQELSKMGDLDCVRALGEASKGDAFWGVQVEAAKALAEIRTNASRDALISALTVKHPKARREIVIALGTFKDPQSTQALKKLAEKDESYFVEADATYAWTLSQLIPVSDSTASDCLPRLEEIEKFLKNKLNAPSYRNVIEAAALKGLSDLPGVGRGERPVALQAILDKTKRGQAMDVRVAAVRALGKVAKQAVSVERARIFEVFNFLSDEEQFRLRMQLVLSLEEIGSPEAIPLLSKMQRLDSDGRVKRSAQMAIDSLLSSTAVPESVLNLKTAFDKLEEGYRKLRTVVEERG